MTPRMPSHEKWLVIGLGMMVLSTIVLGLWVAFASPAYADDYCYTHQDTGYQDCYKDKPWNQPPCAYSPGPDYCTGDEDN